MSDDMKIDVLYFRECPSWENAVSNLKQAANLERVRLDLTIREVTTDEEAKQFHFSGSPTIQADGKDLFPPEHPEYGLSCRLYRTEEGLLGWPSVKMIREKLETLDARNKKEGEA